MEDLSHPQNLAKDHYTADTGPSEHMCLLALDIFTHIVHLLQQLLQMEADFKSRSTAYSNMLDSLQILGGKE